MSGQIDALGGLATAALAAREFDRGSLHDPGAPGHCANCEAPVDGRFCANCGQPAHVHRSVMHVAEEFLHGLTHFDGKAWKTLPLLVFRPGKLTHDYVHGKRARHIPPVALFLLTVFLMFFAFSFVKGPDDLVLQPGAVVFDKKSTAAERREAVRKADAAVVKIKAELAAAEADPDTKPGRTGVLSGALAAAEAMQDQAHAALAQDKPAAKPTPPAAGSTPASADATPTPAGASPEMSATGLMTELSKADKRGDLDINLGSPTLNERARHALANPELTLFKVQSKAYKFSFLLVPLSLPVLWLMFFWKRHIYLYDHAVFALYSLSFMSLLVVLVSALFAAGVRNGVVYGVLFGIVPLAHMFMQLKGAYRLSVFGATWRAVTLATAAVITLSMFVAIIIVIGIVD